MTKILLIRCKNPKQHLKPYPNKAWFLCVCSASLLNTLRKKGEMVHNEQFLLFPQCLLPFWRTFCHFHRIKNCLLKTLSFWNHLTFVVWDRVNETRNNMTNDKKSLFFFFIFPFFFLAKPHTLFDRVVGLRTGG